MAETVTLKDVADKLNISVVTVSNALSGKQGVSESLRKKVFEKAKELGYDTSRYQKKTDDGVKIGVIVSEKYLEVGTSFYWAMYQQVAYAASKRRSFTMFEILDKRYDARPELPRLLQEKEIDGLIVIGWIEHNYIKKIVENADVPVVLLDFYEPDLACDAIMSSNYLGMYKMTKYLLEKGHREIAFVGSVKANDNIMDRFYGYRKGMESYGIRVKDNWVLEDRSLITGDIAIELPKKMPTAFVCNSDLTASFLYDHLKKNGYRVPEDISIVGYDNYLYGHTFAEKITTYNVDMEQMAKNAVKIMLKKIHKKIIIREFDTLIAMLLSGIV